MFPGIRSPGERYVGVLFTVPPGRSAGNIHVAGAVGVGFLVNVHGVTMRRIAVGRLKAPSFAIGGPINFALTVRNLGNVHRDCITPHALHMVTSGNKG